MITINPNSEKYVGSYPFIVRVVDKQNNPADKQYTVNVVDPNAKPEEGEAVVEETVEEEEVKEEAVEAKSIVEEEEEGKILEEEKVEEKAEEDICDAECQEEEKKKQAALELEKALENVVTETSIEIAGLEIEIKLDELTSEESDSKESAITEIMEKVEDMPVEVQEAVFDSVL